MDLGDPTTVALLAVESLDRAGIAHAIYGGLLVAAYGEPRETRDADFAVVDATAEEASRAFREAGVATATSFVDTRFGGLSISRLAVLGSADSTGLNTVDLVRPRSDRYAKVAVERAVTAPLREKPVRVLTPEDFVLFKVLSTRDRDMDDAASVLRKSGELMDIRLLEEEIQALALEISDFDIRTRYAEILRRSGAG